VWPGVALHHDTIDPITFQKPKSKIYRKEREEYDSNKLVTLMTAALQSALQFAVK